MKSRADQPGVGGTEQELHVLAFRFPVLAVPPKRHPPVELRGLDASSGEHFGVCRDEAPRPFCKNTAAERKQLRERKARIQVRVECDPVTCECEMPREQVGDRVSRIVRVPVESKLYMFVLIPSKQHVPVEQFDAIDCAGRYAPPAKVRETQAPSLRRKF